MATTEHEPLQLTVTVAGVTHDLSDLTLAEAEIIEDAFGAPLADIDLNRAKAIRLLYFIARRREDPEFPMAAIENMTIEAVLAPPEGSDRPTRSAKSAPKKKAG